MYLSISLLIWIRDSFFKPLPQTAAGIKRKATGSGKTAAKGGAKAAKGSAGKPRR